MGIEVASGVIERIGREAQAAHPAECCGILLGKGGCITQSLATTNIHPAPETHFEIEPQALIDAHRNAREGGLEVVGYYHAHPNGLAMPSQTDRENSAGDGSIWAIVANASVTFWRDGTDGFDELSYRVVGA